MKNNNINELLEVALSKYRELMKLQDDIKRDPRKLKYLKVDNVDIVEDFHAIKFEPDYEKFMTYSKKCSNIVEVLNKVKDFVNKFSNEIIIDFEVDKEQYTTVAIAGYDGSGDTGKVYLWKSTYEKPDYIKFKTTPMGECKITRIFSQEQVLGHKSFMFNVLKKTLEEHNTSIINNKFATLINEQPVIRKIVAELSENTEAEKGSFHKFFVKNGFEFTEKGIYKMMSKF